MEYNKINRNKIEENVHTSFRAFKDYSSNIMERNYLGNNFNYNFNDGSIKEKWKGKGNDYNKSKNYAGGSESGSGINEHNYKGSNNNNSSNTLNLNISNSSNIKINEKENFNNQNQNLNKNYNMNKNYNSIHNPKHNVPEYKNYKTLDNLNKAENSYMDIKSQFANKEKYNISPLLCNSALYAIQKKKMFCNSNNSLSNNSLSNNSLNNNSFNNNSLNNSNNNDKCSKNVSIEEFTKIKNSSTNTNTNSLTSNLHNQFNPNLDSPYKEHTGNIAALQQNKLNIDRDLKTFRRCRPGIKLIEDFEKGETTKISNDSPDWFKLHNKNKMNEINQNYINNKEPLHILSKFNRWITVTPNGRNRNRPLENAKLTSLENSKIIPNWMIIKPEVTKVPDYFNPIQFTHLKGNTRQVILVDKDQKNAKRDVLFSYFD